MPQDKKASQTDWAKRPFSLQNAIRTMKDSKKRTDESLRRLLGNAKK